MSDTQLGSKPAREEVLGREARSIRAWVRLARVYGRLLRVLETQVKAYGISLGQFDVLTHIARSEGLNQQELAGQLLVTKGNISHLVDRLETTGLVERRSTGGRAYHLYPTPAGRELLETIIPLHNATIVAMLQSMSDERLVALHQSLRNLDLHLDQTLE